MLFRIEGTDVYLFGSLHFGQKSFYPLPAPIETAFNSAHQAWFESSSAPEASSRKAYCPEGRTLDDYISPKTLSRLREVSPRVEMDFEKLRMLKPWGAAFELVPFFWNSVSCTNRYGVDDHFKGHVNAAKQSIHYLETPDEALDFFDSAPLDQQEAFLAWGIFRLADAKQEAQDLLIAWKNSRLGALEGILERVIVRHPFIENAIFGRNRNWVPKLKALVDLGIPTFVCVGALHFVGKGSLPVLMKKDYGLDLVQVSLGRTIR